MLSSLTLLISKTELSGQIKKGFNPESHYLKYRKQDFKKMQYVVQLYKFKPATLHLATNLYDHFLHVRPLMVEYLRSNYKSCFDVMSH